METWQDDDLDNDGLPNRFDLDSDGDGLMYADDPDPSIPQFFEKNNTLKSLI